jgi:choline-sulfatase
MFDDTLSTDRRQFLKTGVAAAGLAGLGRLTSGEARAATATTDQFLAGKPNILIMTVDEQRYPTVHESTELAAFRKTCLKTQEALRQTRPASNSIAITPPR